MICQYPEFKDITCIRNLDYGFTGSMSNRIGYTVSNQLNIGFCPRRKANTFLTVGDIIGLQGKIQSARICCGGSPALIRMLTHHTGIHHSGCGELGGVIAGIGNHSLVHCHIGSFYLQQDACSGIGKIAFNLHNIAILQRIQILNDPLFHLDKVLIIFILNQSACRRIADVVGLPPTNQLNSILSNSLIFHAPICHRGRISRCAGIKTVGVHAIGMLCKGTDLDNLCTHGLIRVLCSEENQAFIKQNVGCVDSKADIQCSVFEIALDLQHVTALQREVFTICPLFCFQIVVGLGILYDHTCHRVGHIIDFTITVQLNNRGVSGTELRCPGIICRHFIGLQLEIDTRIAVGTVGMGFHSTNRNTVWFFYGFLRLFRLFWLRHRNSCGFCAGRYGFLNSFLSTTGYQQAQRKCKQ